MVSTVSSVKCIFTSDLESQAYAKGEFNFDLPAENLALDLASHAARTTS